MEATSAACAPVTAGPHEAPPPTLPATGGFRLSAFGLDVDADASVPGMRPAEVPAHGSNRLSLRFVSPAELLPLCSQPRVLRVLHVFDGCPYAMLDGADGDVLLAYGHRALFHLSPDRRLLRCAPTVHDDPHWQRVLLDTVLWTVASLQGFLLLHASAVETSRGVVAVMAASGGGKSSLAGEYLRRGGLLFSDDIVAVAADGGQLLAFPGPPLMNLPRRLSDTDVGEWTALAEFEEELWVEMHSPRPAPQPLAALVLVERAPGNQTECTRLEGTSLTLLPHTVGSTHEYARDHFDLIGNLAATTPLLRLTAEPSVPTETLADLIDARMDLA